MIRALLIAFLLAGASSALAGPVTLKAQPVDDDGQVTLGELFDSAGAASDVVAARRTGPSVVLDAGMLQATAARAGLTWTNPQGLRRVVVRQGTASAEAAARPAATMARGGAAVEVLTYVRSLAAGDVIQPEDVVWTTLQAHMAPDGAPSDAEQVIGLTARRALRAGAPVAARDLVSPKVISRNELVQVIYRVGGVTLTVTGRASRDAALGEPAPVVNATSGRTIDAVAVGRGKAAARASLSSYSSR